VPAVIQPLRPEHVPAVKQVIRTVWREHFGDDPDPYVRDFLDDDAHLADVEHAARVYQGGGGTFLVTLVDGAVVGTGAVAKVDDETCEMRRMFLLAEHRGRGLGRQMAQRLIAFARDAGYRRMRLASNERLLASHALYHSLGFRDTQPYGHGGGMHALYMERALDDGG
jgi:putative acetyltransferase